MPMPFVVSLNRHLAILTQKLRAPTARGPVVAVPAYRRLRRLRRSRLLLGLAGRFEASPLPCPPALKGVDLGEMGLAAPSPITLWIRSSSAPPSSAKRPALERPSSPPLKTTSTSGFDSGFLAIVFCPPITF